MSTDFLRLWADLEPPRRVLSPSTLDRARIPREFWHNDPKAIGHLAHGPDVLDYLGDIAKHHRERKGLFLWGPRGTGKSSLAARVLIEVIRRADPVTRTLWASAKDVARYGRLAERGNEEAAASIDRLHWNQWVVVDELGLEHPEWDTPAVEQVVKARYHNRRPTVITTNLKLAEVVARYPWLEGLLAQRYAVIEVPGAERGGRDWRQKEVTK